MKTRTDSKKSKYIRKKAYVAVCLFSVVICLFSSCSSFDEIIPGLVDDITATETTSGGEDEKTFSLPLNTTEALDCYNSVSRINYDLLTLCYSGLITVDGNYDARGDLADGFVQQGATVIFTIKEDAVFSDGSLVTSEDCEYSFNLAENSARYADSFKSIRSWSAHGSKAFSVTFKYAGSHYVNLCTVPIVKNGTSFKDGYATGAGKYMLLDTSEGIVLRANPYREDMKNASLVTINTVEYTDSGYMISDFNYSVTDAVYADLSEGSSKYRGGIQLSGFTSNSLILLAVNGDRSFASSYRGVCKGLTRVIDRSALYENVLKGCAVMTWTPYNPSWSKTEEADIVSDIYDPDTAAEYFYKARLYKDEDWRYRYYGDTVTLDIVVNSDNGLKVDLAQAVAEQLEAAGFGAKVKALSWENYIKAVEDKDYDILLAEVTVGADMDIRTVCDAIGFDLGTGALYSAFEKFAAGKTDIRSVLEVFSEEMPFIPICYARSALALNLDVTGDVSPTECFLFYNIENWKK